MLSLVSCRQHRRIGPSLHQNEWQTEIYRHLEFERTDVNLNPNVDQKPHHTQRLLLCENKYFKDYILTTCARTQRNARAKSTRCSNTGFCSISAIRYSVFRYSTTAICAVTYKTLIPTLGFLRRRAVKQSFKYTKSTSCGHFRLVETNHNAISSAAVQSAIRRGTLIFYPYDLSRILN